ncbi:hypothetical protein BH20ACI3_BH20ACI3_20950 [soil metagenome]
MEEDELKKRTKRFGLRIMKLVAALPKMTSSRVPIHRKQLADKQNATRVIKSRINNLKYPSAKTC